MKSLLLSALLFFAAFAMSGCVISENGVIWMADEFTGSGNRITETRQLEGVRALRLATSGELTIRIGEQEQIELEGDDNILPLINTEVEDGELTISFDSGRYLRTKEGPRFTLTVRSLEALRAASSGDIIAPALTGQEMSVSAGSSGDIRIDRIDAEQLDIRSGSSGDIHIGALNAKRLKADLGSSGDVHIGGGSTAMQRVRISSSGDYNAGAMSSLDAEVRSSSSGDASVWVTRRLRKSTTSSGDVQVRGNPKVE